MPLEAPQPQPSNIEAEQALLGALLLNNDVVDRLPAGFDAEMFYDPVHGRIFALASRWISGGRLVSAVTIKPYLVDDEGLKELGGTDYLARLAGATISIGSARDYAETIRDLWVRRAAVRALEEGLAKVATLSAEIAPHEALEGVQGEIAIIAANSNPKPITHDLGSALATAARRLEAQFKNDGEPLISTGLKRLDRAIGGFMPADHIVLLAESSMCKTGLAIDIAWNVVRQGMGVFIGSLEMPSDQIAQRITSRVLAERGQRVEYSRLMNGRFSEDEFRAYLELARDIESQPMEFAEDDASSLPRLMNAAQAAKRKFERKGLPLGLVVIDYLQQINVPGAKSETERVSTAARAMKTLAKSLDAPVMSLCQMNNDNKLRKGPEKRPRKSDARQSGEIEESADILIGCYREAYYLARDIQCTADGPEKSDMIAALPGIKHNLELIILKQRRGPIETVHAWADVPVNRFLDEAPAKHGTDTMEFK